MKGNTRILLLGLLTLTLFPLVGFIIDWIVTGSLEFIPSVFISHIGLLQELLLGAIVGTAMGLIGWQIILTPVLKPVLRKYGGVVKSLKLSLITIIFVSICAGVGEEIFFRGILQNYLGVIITAVVFVAIHGYLDPRDWRVSLYGAYMTGAIIGLGYMNEYLGLTSAMTAHTFIDIVLFYQLTHSDKIVGPNEILISRE